MNKFKIEALKESAERCINRSTQMTVAPAAILELIAEVERLQVENDRLMVSNGAMRRKMDEIAMQYAADCL